MAWSRRKRHRDRDPGLKHVEESSTRPADTLFGLTEAQRQAMAQSLRYIDAARRAIEAQQNPDNREIIRELKASADHIYDLLNSLEELDRESQP
jgi:DNA-binding PadR family transcriptional regulator